MTSRNRVRRRARALAKKNRKTPHTGHPFLWMLFSGHWHQKDDHFQHRRRENERSECPVRRIMSRRIVHPARSIRTSTLHLEYAMCAGRVNSRPLCAMCARHIHIRHVHHIIRDMLGQSMAWRGMAWHMGAGLNSALLSVLERKLAHCLLTPRSKT